MRIFRDRRLQAAGLTILFAGLAVWSLAPAGIIELGKKGQKNKGSYYRIIADTVTVEDPNSPALTDAYAILEGLRLQLVAHGFQATHVDPNLTNPYNAIQILTTTGGEPQRLGTIVDDDPNGIYGGGSKVDSGSLVAHPTPPVYFVKGLNAASGNDTGTGDGQVTVNVTLQSGPLAPIVISTNVSGATPEDKAAEVNKQIVQALNGAGLNASPASPAASEVFSVRSPSNKIQSFSISVADTLATQFDVRRANEPWGSGGHGRIPTLSAWGLAALALLLAGMAIWLLRRRSVATG